MARHFTVEEATALLPQITPMLEEIVALRERLQQAEKEGAALHWKARANGHVNPERSLTADQSARAELVATISAHIARLHELGVELKDPSIGLIDFPTRRGDRIVLLCWKLGEPAIEYWHEVDAGYAGRQPL